MWENVDEQAYAELVHTEFKRLTEMVGFEFKKTTITPGGRVGDDRSTGSRSNGENWVEQRGGLPRYIRIVRNGLMREGHSESRATALAIAAIKRWARGGGGVSAKVQAAAKAALAQWEAMKNKKSDQILYELEVKLVAAGEDTASGSNGKRVVASEEGVRRYGKPIGEEIGSDDEPKNPADKKKKGEEVIKIKPGDTLSALAERYDTTVADLMKLNPKIKDANLIYAGDDLVVSGEKEVTEGERGGKGKASERALDAPEGDPEGGKASGGTAPAQPPRKPSGGAKQRVSLARTKRTRTIRISSGDTLGELANRHGTTVRHLMRLNPSIKNPDMIYAGDDLRVPRRNKRKKPSRGVAVAESTSTASNVGKE